MSTPTGVEVNGNGAGAWNAESPSTSALGELVSERPEVALAAAFLGGVVVARILKRLGR